MEWFFGFKNIYLLYQFVKVRLGSKLVQITKNIIILELNPKKT